MVVILSWELIISSVRINSNQEISNAYQCCYPTLVIKSNPPVLSYMDALFSSEEDKTSQVDASQANNSDDDDDDDSDDESTKISKNPFLEPPQKRPNSP